MKKLIVVLSVIVMFSFAACGGGGGDKSTSPASVSPSVDVSSKEKHESAPASSDVSVEEQVLMDQDGIKITLMSLESGEDLFSMGPELKVLIENDGDQPVSVQTRDVSVNGIMMDPWFSCDVEPGKKANDGVTLLSSDLKMAGIEKIKDVELRFHVFDPSSYDTLFDTDPISIVTSAADYIQVYDDSGTVALDQDGFKIIVKKLESQDSFWGADIYVYVENNSGTDATIQVRDTSVNGFMVDPSFSCDILSGKKAFSSITFFESDLEANDITDITDIELKFHVFSLDGWDNIFDSESINITF